MHIRVGIFYLAGFPLTIVYTTQRDAHYREKGRESKTREGKGGKRKREREKGREEERKEEGGGMEGGMKETQKNIFGHY